MATHEFKPTRYFTTIGSHDPVLSIGDGDTVVTSTVDSSGCDARGEQVTEAGNPQTGPFFIEGAEPGDTLVVHLDELRPNRSSGYGRTVLAPNVVEPAAVVTLPDEAMAEWSINLAAGLATLVDPATSVGSLTLPLAPMLGCFGVAPARRQAISTATSGQHGGNMDYRGFTQGVTAYFPVFVPGALFHLGDGHALQGDGELVGTGIEVSFDVRFTVRVLKGRLRHWPCGDNGREIFAVGNGRPLDQALQFATTQMLAWLIADFGLDKRGACILLGQCATYDIANVYNPAYSVACKVSRALLDLQAASGEAASRICS